MKKSIILVAIVGIFILGILAFSMNAVEDENTLTVGMSGGYRPYTFLDDSGELKGFDVDVWKEIGKRIDYSIEFETSDFSGLFGKLESGQINTIANQITITEERQEKYDFSKPYVYYGAQLVSKEGNSEIKDLESLQGKKVGVSLGSNYEKMIKDSQYADQIDVITYENFQGSLQDVSNGRLDAVLNDRLAALTAVNESGLDLQLAGEPLEILSNAFPFVKNDSNEELISKVDIAITEMYEDGTMEELSLKWFPVNITEIAGE